MKKSNRVLHKIKKSFVSVIVFVLALCILSEECVMAGDYSRVTPGSNPEVVTDFEFTRTLVNCTPVFVPELCSSNFAKQINKSGNMVVDGNNAKLEEGEYATILLPGGYRYYDGKCYDIYIKVTQVNSGYEKKSSWGEWQWWCKIDSENSYIQLLPDIKHVTNVISWWYQYEKNVRYDFDIYIKDENNNTATDISFVAGSCYTAEYEGARPWSDNNKIYTNLDGAEIKFVDDANMNWDSDGEAWKPVTENGTNKFDDPSVYILGHGKSEDGSVKGGYYSSDPAHKAMAEIVLGYLSRKVTFILGDTSVVVDGAEDYALGSTFAAGFNENHPEVEYWKSNTSVLVQYSDGSSERIAAGNPISADILENVIVEQEMTMTAYYHEFTFEQGESSIKAVCLDPGHVNCKYTSNPVELTFKVPNIVAGNTPSPVINDISKFVKTTRTNESDFSVEYYDKNGVLLAAAPTEHGIYNAKLNFANAASTFSLMTQFTIAHDHMVEDINYAGAQKTEAVAPTCTEKGREAYYKCFDEIVDSNVEVVSEDGRLVSLTELDIAPLGHDFSGDWTTTVAPTYTSKGVEDTTCTRVGCNETTTREINMLSHDHLAVDVNSADAQKTEAVEPTCTEKGRQAYYKCFDSNVNSEEFVVTEDGDLVRLTDLDIEALGHDFTGEWTRTVEPTYEEKGLEETTCARAGCQEKSTREVDKLVEEPPTEEPPTEEPPTEEPPTQEPPVEEPPVEEPIVEEVPAEEPTVEEAPAEEPVIDNPDNTETVVPDTEQDKPVEKKPAKKKKKKTTKPKPVVVVPSVDDSNVDDSSEDTSGVDETVEETVEEAIVDEVTEPADDDSQESNEVSRYSGRGLQIEFENTETTYGDGEEGGLDSININGEAVPLSRWQGIVEAVKAIGGGNTAIGFSVVIIIIATAIACAAAIWFILFKKRRYDEDIE